MKKIIFIILLAIIGFGSKTMGQGNCGNALQIYPQDSLISQSINATDSVFWLKFTATDTAFYFNLVKSDTSALTSIYLYHAGNGCNNYTLITSSVNKVYIKNENLLLNNVYFVKITQNKSLSYSLFYSTKMGELGISAGFSPSGLNPYLYVLYPGTIQKEVLTVCENDFFWLRPVVPNDMPEPPIMFKFSMIIYDANGFVISSSIQPLDYNVNNLSCSFSISTPGIYFVDLVMWDINVSNPQFQGSGTNTNPNYSHFPSNKFYINVLDDNPNSDILNVPTAKTCVGTYLELYNQDISGASFNFGNLEVHQSITGTIFTNCPCPGNFPISATVDNGCGVTTTNYNLLVSVKPEIDCRDAYCHYIKPLFRGNTCIDNNINYLQYCSYLWDFGDGTTSNQKNPPEHSYTTPGSYYIQFTVTFYNPNTGCNYTETATKIITIYKVEKPEIIGNNTNCDKNNSYQLLNNYNIQSFNWSLSFYQVHSPVPGAIDGPNDQPEVNVSWLQDYLDCPLADVIVITEDENRCMAVDTFTVFPCCKVGTAENIYTSAVTFSGTQILNSTNIYVFNEDVTINGDISFVNTWVYMGPNTKIIINPGAKLTIDNSTVSHLRNCCFNMWDGIYLEDPTCELNIINNSFIQNAQNAVVARNRAVINLAFSTFRNNYRNVVIENSIITMPYDYSPYPALIRGCTFKGEPNYLLTNPPYAGVQTFSGIETKNILNLTIGEYITDPSYTNYFEKMYCGIKGVNSNLYIYNNTFTDIRVPAGASYGNNGNDPTAIYVPTAIHSVFNGKLKDLAVSEIIAGGTGNPYVLNTIDNSINGIYTYNQRVDITGNTVEAEIYGIRNKDIHNDSRVSFNNVNSTALFVNTGINIVNIQPAYANLKVHDNIVFPSARGISISNVLAEPRNGQYRVEVYNNHVFFHTDNYGGFYRDRSGIESNNCDGIVISCNEVARLLASEPDFYTNLFGINIVQTMHAQVRDNYNLHKLGAGINVYSDCNYSNYQCNSLKFNYRGFLFNIASSVSQQGTDLTNTDNYFEGTYYDSPTYRKFWAISPNMPNVIDWHVRDNPGFNYGIDNISGLNPTLSFINEVQNSSSASSACADCSVGSIEEEVQWTKEKREEVFGKTVRNEVVYDTLNTEFTTYDQEMLYRLLKEDSTLMNMGDTSDIAYQQFYATNQNSNIGKIVETQELIKKGEVNEALLRNEAVQDQKLIDYYMKEVNNIYLSSYARSNYQLSAQQIDFLTTIANLTPWEGGDAVFIARYMLDIDPNQLTADFAKAAAAMPNSMESRANMAKLYPNPAKDEVMIAFEKATDSQGLLEIYGFTGSVIQSQNLASGYQYISVSVKDLKPGIYFYRILLNNEVVAKDKLLIVK